MATHNAVPDSFPSTYRGWTFECSGTRFLKASAGEQVMFLPRDIGLAQLAIDAYLEKGAWAVKAAVKAARTNERHLHASSEQERTAANGAPVLGTWAPSKVSAADDVDLVARHAERVLDLANAGVGERFYQSLPPCVLDAVFSIGVRYAAVRNVVARYCAEAGVREFRLHGSPCPPREEQESIGSFCARLRSWGTPDRVGARLGSRQRTSTHPTSSMLKAEAALRFAEQLRAHGIEHLQDMAGLSPQREALVQSAIRTIRGQGSGLSWDYFRMLSGSEDLVKADRMVLRFVAAAVRHPVSREIAADLVRRTAVGLQPRYPHLTPRLLDGAIWSYQSAAAAL